MRHFNKVEMFIVRLVLLLSLALQLGELVWGQLQHLFR